MSICEMIGDKDCIRDHNYSNKVRPFQINKRKLKKNLNDKYHKL